MNTTYSEQACFLLEISNTKIFFDLFVTPNLAAKKINMKAIKAAYSLHSHGRQDRRADVEEYQNTTATKANFELKRWYPKKGLKKHTRDL